MDAKKENSNRFLQIGAVARSFGVCENTIRRLEKADLLEPAITVEGSGYRYYDCENLLLLTELFALKSFGFDYEDLREYLKTPGDYSALYEKLLEKQTAISILVDAFKRRVKADDVPNFQIIELSDTWCLCRDTVMPLEPKAISRFIRETLYDAVLQAVPLDYTKSLQIVTECTDFTCPPPGDQKLTFCVPLTGETEGESIRFFPRIKALSVLWDISQLDYQGVISLIEKQFAENGLTQDGRLRIIYNIGEHLGRGKERDEKVRRVLVPFR